MGSTLGNLIGGYLLIGMINVGVSFAFTQHGKKMLDGARTRGHAWAIYLGMAINVFIWPAVLVAYGIRAMWTRKICPGCGAKTAWGFCARCGEDLPRERAKKPGFGRISPEFMRAIEEAAERAVQDITKEIGPEQWTRMSKAQQDEVRARIRRAVDRDLDERATREKPPR